MFEAINVRKYFFLYVLCFLGKYNSKRSSNSKGVALLELVIVLPFLSALLFGSIEFSMAFRNIEHITFINRVVGDRVVRECVKKDFYDFSLSTQEALEKSNSLHDCMSLIIKETEQQVFAVLPELQLTISIYEKNSNGELKGLNTFNTDKLVTSQPSKYDETNIGELVTPFIEHTKTVVVAESWTKFVTYFETLHGIKGGDHYIIGVF